jgi:hypothetical protein
LTPKILTLRSTTEVLYKLMSMDKCQAYSFPLTSSLVAFCIRLRNCLIALVCSSYWPAMTAKNFSIVSRDIAKRKTG